MAKTTRNKIPKRRPMRSISALKKEADMWFSRRIRLRDADSKGYCKCISCGSRLHWKQMHNCHFIGRSNYFYRRDPKNCRAGCASCNTYRQQFHMMQYTLYMVKMYGLEEVQKMQDTHWELKKVKREMLEEIIDEYKELVKEHPLYNTNPKPSKVPKLTAKERKEQEIQDRIDEAVYYAMRP